MTLVFLVVLVLVVIWLVKPYIQRYDNVILYTGTLGSGKTFCAVKTAKKLLKKNRIKVFFYNLFHTEKLPRPMLYSNIPIRVTRSEYSLELKAEHFTMTEAVIPRSVILCDEISLMLSQQDFKTVNDKALVEFVSLYRQYTKNGYIVLTTQNVKKVNHNLRRIIDTAYHLQDFRFHLPLPFLRFFYSVGVRHIDITEDTVNVNASHSEDSNSRIIGFVGMRSYDTHAYYPRYKGVPFGVSLPHKKLQTLKLCKIPVKTRLPNYVNTTEDDKRD